MIDDMGNFFEPELREVKSAPRSKFSDQAPTLNVRLSAAPREDSKVWYEGIELRGVTRVQIDADIDDITEVTITFRGINVNREVVTKST